MEKVKVSREVACEIESVLKANLGDKNDALARHAEGWFGNPLQHVSLIDFATALIVGYEIKETPQEHVERLFREEWNNSQCVAVVEALQILNIKITGVNQ